MSLFGWLAIHFSRHHEPESVHDIEHPGIDQDMHEMRRDIDQIKRINVYVLSKAVAREVITEEGAEALKITQHADQESVVPNVPDNPEPPVKSE